MWVYRDAGLNEGVETQSSTIFFGEMEHFQQSAAMSCSLLPLHFYVSIYDLKRVLSYVKYVALS